MFLVEFDFSFDKIKKYAKNIFSLKKFLETVLNKLKNRAFNKKEKIQENKKVVQLINEQLELVVAGVFFVVMLLITSIVSFMFKRKLPKHVIKDISNITYNNIAEELQPLFEKIKLDKNLSNDESNYLITIVSLFAYSNVLEKLLTNPYKQKFAKILEDYKLSDEEIDEIFINIKEIVKSIKDVITYQMIRAPKEFSKIALKYMKEVKNNRLINKLANKLIEELNKTTKK